jgi:hypothetical protein
VSDGTDGGGGSGSDVVCRLFMGLIAEVLGELLSGGCCLDWMGSGRFPDSVLLGLVIWTFDVGSPHRVGGAFMCVGSEDSVWCDSVWIGCGIGADAVEASILRLTVLASEYSVCFGWEGCSCR